MNINYKGIHIVQNAFHHSTCIVLCISQPVKYCRNEGFHSLSKKLNKT